MQNFFSAQSLDACRVGHSSPGKTSVSSARRRHNILWGGGLDRDGLCHRTLERQLHMVTTSAGEHLYIQYPGKESQGNPDKQGSARPWDFRPKLVRLDGSVGDDLSFMNIWDILFDRLDSIRTARPGIIRMIAILFYRMAFMCDHRLLAGRTYAGYDLDTSTAGPRTPSASLMLELPERFEYEPDRQVISEISNVVEDWGGMSLEAFLHYNELLAWNEDCKYYYRDVEIGGKDWIDKIGRINNLLTHVSLLGVMLEDIRLSHMLSRFSQLRGVAPANFKEIAKVTAGYCEA